MRKILIAAGVGAAALVAVWVFASGVLSLGGREQEHPASRAPVVSAAIVAKDKFVESIEAIGTARAEESVEITAKTADTIGAINFTEGQPVEAGAILVEMTSTQQAADLLAARAELAEAEKAYDRAADLVSKGIAAKASLDSAIGTRDAARGRVQSIEAKLADTIIKAPFAGVVGLRNVSVGSFVSPGDVITTLDDISPIKGDFTVPERLIGMLKPGLKIEASVAAYPGETFDGTVSNVDTRIDPATRAVTVRAEIPNEARRLLPGMLMSVTLIVSEREAIAVPESALVAQGSSRYVFRIDAEAKAHRVDVKTGLVKPGSVEILEGLNEGDRVVSQGTNKVTPGQPVTIDAEQTATPVAGTPGAGPT
jgi:membrane fusion protein (multidrug efflux system)